VFEQPVSRTWYAAVKLLNGAAHAALAALAAVLLAPIVFYALMLASGKVSTAGSWPNFAGIFGEALRAAPWCSLVSAAAFAGAALISAVSPRWWLAAVGGIVLAVALGNVVMGDSPWVGGAGFFELIPTVENRTMSVSVSFPSPQWLVVSDVLPMPNTFARWRWSQPLLAMAMLAACCIGLAAVYRRKELK
jgi:hypothetical protein